MKAKKTVVGELGVYDGANRVYSDSNPPQTLLISEYGGAVPTPAAGTAVLYSTAGAALLMKDDAGVVRTVGAAAGVKGSALTAASSLADTDVLIGVNGGVSKKFDLTTLTQYFEQRGRQTNCSVANQTPTGATDTYLVGSDVSIPAGRLQAKSRYRMNMAFSKTAAGVASVVLAVRIGTAGSTADTARATLTFAVQTGVADEGQIDLNVYFRTVGGGTSAVIRADAILDHRLAVTGWTTVNSSLQGATSAGFDSTVANLKIGCSAIMGSATIATITSVGAELFNLA